ncbi:MAG: MEKHLA domain-containing protein [Pseudomonadota bacterium]
MTFGPVLAAPGEENDFQHAFVQKVLASHARVTGRPLLPGLGGHEVWSGNFALLTHRGDPQAMLNYGNKRALDLWECDWNQFIATPSSATAPAEGRAARETMMQQVIQNGFVTGYSGQRISRTGRPFLIQDVTIWRLMEENGEGSGVAAFFRRYQRL